MKRDSQSGESIGRLPSPARAQLFVGVYYVFLSFIPREISAFKYLHDKSRPDLPNHGQIRRLYSISINKRLGLLMIISQRFL